MELILLRHADAGERDAKRYPDDDLRPLVARGRKRQAAVARFLRKRGVRPDLILTSPRVRARETAEITARVLARRRIEEEPVLGRGFSVARAVRALARRDVRCLLCVGHEPDLSRLAAALLGGVNARGLRFKKSGVLAIGFEGRVRRGGGRLLYAYRPRDVL